MATISTVTFAGIPLGFQENLTIDQFGAIVAGQTSEIGVDAGGSNTMSITGHVFSFTGIAINSSFVGGNQITVAGSGSLFAGSRALALTGTGNIVVNNGDISSANFSIFSNDSNTLTNTGRFTGLAGAVEFYASNNQVTNSGVIEGLGGAAITFGGVLNNVINSGTITSNTFGIDYGSPTFFAAGPNTVTNTGTIFGSTAGIRGSYG
jgi:hypothetical protein